MNWRKTSKTASALLPWLVGLGLLGYLFYKIPPQALLQSLAKAHLVPLLGYALLYFFAIACLDTWGLSKVLSQFCAPLSFKNLWPARCVSYLLSLLNYNAGQAALAASLKKTRGFSLFKTLGGVFFVTATDLYWIITLAFVGSFFMDLSIQGIQLSHWIQNVGYIAFAALLLHLAFWHRWFDKILPTKIHFGFSDWIRGRHLFQAFHHAKLKDYLRIALYRLPMHLIFIATMWILVRLFGGTITWQDVWATVPIIFLLGALPITPGGLGAVQIATVELLKDKAVFPNTSGMGVEETLFALSLSWMALNYILKALWGLFYLRQSEFRFFKPNSTLVESTSNATHQP